MLSFGYLAGLRTLFDSVMSATALYSSSCWAGMTAKDYEWIDKEQKRLLFTMLRINSKTTVKHVLHELGLIQWSWLVKKEKISRKLKDIPSISNATRTLFGHLSNSAQKPLTLEATRGRSNTARMPLSFGSDTAQIPLPYRSVTTQTALSYRARCRWKVRHLSKVF